MKGQIKNFALGIYDGPHATPKESDDGAIFLGIKNVTPEGRLDFSTIRYVSEEEFPKWTKRVTPQDGDVVLSYEATLHRYALIPEGFRGCLGRRMALVRPNQDKLYPRFLHYYFLSPKWRQIVDSNTIIGATVNRIPIKYLPNFEVDFPKLNEQKRIASILSVYDDLIENNRRRIKLLEKSARLLYTEWFVHFRFPGHEHSKIIDGVPEGWEKKPLRELCYQYKKTIKPKEVSPDTPYIGLGNIPRRSITLSDWEKSEKVTSSKYIFQKGDILFGKIRPYFHKVGFALCNGITSSDSVVLRAQEKIYYCYILAYVSSDNFIQLASKTCREGAKMPRADWKFLEKQAVLVPSKILLVEFSEQENDILKQLETLALYNKKLAQARDLLLPRLMNGEIEV